MKIALVHDDLMRRGGAEQVVLSMLRAYPNADLYTMCYQPDLTYSEFREYKIRTSLFDRFAKSEKVMKRLFFPLGLLSMKIMRLKGYDVVLISNTYCAKYVSISKGTKVFIYTYTPFRLAWNSDSYEEYSNATGLKRFLLNQLLRILRRIDASEARKGDFFLSMTGETAERVRRAYHPKDVTIIPPPVKCKNFYVSDKRLDYYLIVSRLEVYKNVDLAIKAFNQTGLRLIIVGTGSKKEQLKAMAQSNIEFRSGLSKEEIAALYANCRAFVFPQHEDYGITPLEANASGRPVIAFKKGGVLETMVPYNGQDLKFTSVFFNEQTVESLNKAIELMESLEIDPAFIRAHAEKFDEPFFVQRLIHFVNQSMRR